MNVRNWSARAVIIAIGLILCAGGAQVCKADTFDCIGTRNPNSPGTAWDDVYWNDTPSLNWALTFAIDVDSGQTNTWALPDCKTLDSGSGSISGGAASFHAKKLCEDYLTFLGLSNAPYAYHNYGMSTVTFQEKKSSSAILHYDW